MPGSNRQMNWTAVTATVATVATVLNGITDVSIDGGTQFAKFAGDADRFSTTIVNSMNDPTIRVTSGNEAQLQALAGAVGSFSCTHKDAKGLTGGDIVYTLANAVFGNASIGGRHAQFGEATLEIACYSSDGQTNPLSFSRS